MAITKNLTHTIHFLGAPIWHAILLTVKYVLVFVNKHNSIGIFEQEDNSSLGGLLSSW